MNNRSVKRDAFKVLEFDICLKVFMSALMYKLFRLQLVHFTFLIHHYFFFSFFHCQKILETSFSSILFFYYFYFYFFFLVKLSPLNFFSFKTLLYVLINLQSKSRYNKPTNNFKKVFIFFLFFILLKVV